MIYQRFRCLKNRRSWHPQLIRGKPPIFNRCHISLIIQGLFYDFQRNNVACFRAKALIYLTSNNFLKYKIFRYDKMSLRWQRPACPLKYGTHHQLVFHVNGKHANKDWKPPFNCGQNNWYRIYENFASWSQQLRKVHDKPTNVTASNIKASNDGSCTKGGGVSQDVPETNIQEPETDGETDQIELGIGSIREAGINFCQKCVRAVLLRHPHVKKQSRESTM